MNLALLVLEGFDADAEPMLIPVATRVLPALIAIVAFAGCGREAPPASSASGSSQVHLGERDADQVTTEQPAPTCGEQYVSGKVIKFERGIVGLLDTARYNKYIEVPIDKIIGTLRLGDWARYELADKQPYALLDIGTCAQFAFRPADPPPPPTAEELAKCGGWNEGRVKLYSAAKNFALIEPMDGRRLLSVKSDVLEGRVLVEGAAVAFRANGYEQICELEVYS